MAEEKRNIEKTFLKVMAEKFQTDENYKPKVARNKNTKHMKHKDDYCKVLHDQIIKSKTATEQHI